MDKSRIVYKLFFGICFLAIISQETINAQIVIGRPNLGFSQACASESFNTFNTTFTFSGQNSLNASNQFSIEMSNAEGDFSDPLTIFTSNPGAITESPATLSFSIPTDTAGENYRIRIKTSSPAAISSSSNAFAAYFRIQDSPFSINNLVSTGAYCTGESYLLTIDNPGSGLNDSPLQYPSLTYNWFRETGPTTSVFITQANTLSVSEEGTYFVETNYGTCTSNSFSNRVTVSEVNSNQDNNTDIVSSLGNPFCPNQGATTLSTIGGDSHQWFINGIIIPEATNRQLQVIESGTYSVQVDLGECSASASIDLESELFDATINVSDVVDIEEGETVSVELTTTANNPEFEWYLNDVLITDAISNSFDATEFGNYRVVVTETMGCNGSREFLFEIREALDPFPEVENIPNLISPNGDNINDTWVIPPRYVSGTNTMVMIMNNQGQVILQTNDYLNNWPENDLNLSSINQIFYYVITTTGNETKRGSITLVK